MPTVRRAEARHSPALLINQDRRVIAADRLAQRRDQIADLRGVAAVAAEEDEANRIGGAKEAAVLGGAARGRGGLAGGAAAADCGAWGVAAGGGAGGLDAVAGGCSRCAKGPGGGGTGRGIGFSGGGSKRSTTGRVGL